MKAFLDFMYYKRALPKKSVLITIDDGHRSAYEIAYPILKKVGFRATIFVYTDFVGKAKGAVTWEQLREMKKAGFEVGSHTVSHCDLLEKHDKEDPKAYLDRVRKELALSKQILDRELKQQTLYLAFPYGHHDQRILGLSEKMGYKLAFTVKKGGNPFFADPLVLKRTQVTERQIKAFKGYLKTFYPFDLKSVRE